MLFLYNEVVPREIPTTQKERANDGTGKGKRVFTNARWCKGCGICVAFLPALRGCWGW